MPRRRPRALWVLGLILALAPIVAGAQTDEVEPESGQAEAGKAGTGQTEAPPLPSVDQVSDRIDHLEREARRSGSDVQRDALYSALSDLYLLRGRLNFRAGDVEQAINDLDRSLDIDEGQVRARRDLAWIELEHGSRSRALTLIETGLLADPNDGFLLEARGEYFYRENRLRDALADYRRAVELRPDDEPLAERLVKVSRDVEAERNYAGAHSRHFVLRFDSKRDESLEEPLHDALEAAFDDLSRELSVYPREPITVILYSQRQFHETTEADEQVVGLYDGKIRLPIGGVSRISEPLNRIIRHELVHALIHTKAGNGVPRWLHEGLAQRHEPRSIERAHRHVHASGAALEPFSYPASLSFVAFLEQSFSADRWLWFLEELAARAAETDAFVTAFGTSKQELIEQWQLWVAQHS